MRDSLSAFVVPPGGGTRIRGPVGGPTIINARYPDSGGPHSDAQTQLRLFVMNADGSDSQPVTPADVNVSSFAWSPDGSQLVFTRIGSDFESCRLVVASAETGAERELVSYDALGGCAQSPVWEPSATPPDGSSS